MKEIAPNEIVISEEVKAMASELWLNSMGLPTHKESWSMPLVSEKTIARKVQALLNASTARLQEAHNEAHGKAAQEIARLREELITRGMEIAAERERVELLKQERNGKWVDKWGACRVCDGEIPHGHTDNCDVLKLEREIDALREQSDRALRAACECAEQFKKERDNFERLADLNYNAARATSAVLNERDQLRFQNKELRSALIVIRDAACGRVAVQTGGETDTEHA